MDWNLFGTQRCSAAAMGLLFAALGSCAPASDGLAGGAGQADDLSEENNEIKARVAALGFSTDEIAFVGEYVRVEGDIILLREGILSDSYAPIHGDEASFDKGYKTPYSVANYTNIKLVKIQPATPNPGATIWNAVVAAANDFNAVSPSLLSISPSNTGPAITIYEVPVANWPGTPCGDKPSCALFPTSNGAPGALVYVKAAQLGPNCPGWTANGLANRMRHELGHAIGLAHAEQGAHIAGTQWCMQANPADCENFPTYVTVMKSLELCTPTIVTLQSDDRASVQALYP